MISEKSKSISQQRIMGMTYAVRKGKLKLSNIEDNEFRDKIKKIANSDNFSDDSLKKYAETKYRKSTGKLRPYKIGKGTEENPDKKRRPYKKNESYIFKVKSLSDFIKESEASLNPGMNSSSMGPVTQPGNPGTSSDFSNQKSGSGDYPLSNKKKKDDEDDENSNNKKNKSKNKK